MRKILLATLQYKLEILISFLFILMAVATHNGNWIGDFWEHVSIIKELSYAPFSPKHPLYLSNAPHALYTPYSLFLGLLSRYTDFSVISILSVVGMLNLVFLLSTVSAFVLSLYHDRKIIFYTLLITIFAWYMPWTYSGFISINTLAYVLPYPATFCMALMFLIFHIYYSWQKKVSLFILIAILTAIIIVSHPLTGLVCCAGVFSLAISANGFKLNRQNILTAIALLIAILIPFLWPYYSFYELLMGAKAAYHGNNAFMYDRPFLRSFPALLGIPLLYVFYKKDKKSPLIIMFSILLLIYVYGYVSKGFMFGRVISFLAIIIHIYAGRYLAFLEGLARSSKLQRAVFFLALMAIAVLGAKHIEKIVYPFFQVNQPSPYEAYFFLAEHTSQYDVILSDIKTSLFVPAFGGKIVACTKPNAFIENAQIRVNDVKAFFNDCLTIGEKIHIIKKYKVDYVLINKALFTTKSIENDIDKVGKLKFSNNKHSLYAIDAVAVLNYVSSLQCKMPDLYVFCTASSTKSTMCVKDGE